MCQCLWFQCPPILCFLEFHLSFGYNPDDTEENVHALKVGKSTQKVINDLYVSNAVKIKQQLGFNSHNVTENSIATD